jgi:uncharacterized protein YqeY
MKLKEQIQSDFIEAMKSKNEIAKSAISGLKAKITEAEKVNGSTNSSDDVIVGIVTKAIKQRKESADAFIKGNRHDLVTKELAEIDVLSKYLPSQMTESEIETAVKEIMAGIDAGGNMNKLVGQTMGMFNKKFQGRADNKLVSSIINKLATA